MIKKLFTLSALLFALNANAFNNEQANRMCDDNPEMELACMAYFIGITESWRFFHYLSDPECKKYKTLSPLMVMAAFKTNYKTLDPEADNVLHLSSYIMENGGCEKTGK